MRIGIARFWTESTSWSPLLCDLEMFRCGALRQGDDMLAFYRAGSNEVSGFLDVLSTVPDCRPIGLLGAHASCAGPLRESAWQHLRKRHVDLLQQAGRLDGVLMSLHGATLSENDDDVCGTLLQTTRETVGPHVPIVATLDMHGNPTGRMAANADALIAYKTYPHRDFAERGRQAAEILVRALRREVRPSLCVISIPLTLNSLPLLEQLVGRCVDAERDPRVLACSIMPTHWPLDVVEFHPLSAVVVTDDQPELGRQIGQELMWRAWQQRDQVTQALPLVPIDQAMAQLPSLPRGTIVMADRNDAVTAGFPGDSAEIIRALLDAGVRDRACTIVHDPDFVQRAVVAGVGGKVDGPLGGKWGGTLYGPVQVCARVRALSDGTLQSGDADAPGHLSVSNSSMGLTAVVQIHETITAVVTSVPVMSTEPAAYRSVGVEPREHRIVVTKSVAQQRHNYALIASAFIDLDGPGWMRVADSYRWKKRPPIPIYPDPAVTDESIRRSLGIETSETFTRELA